MFFAFFFLSEWQRATLSDGSNLQCVDSFFGVRRRSRLLGIPFADYLSLANNLLESRQASMNEITRDRMMQIAD